MFILLTSTLLVALAEIGDKTQLLALALTLHYRRPVPIIIGIVLATVLNHFLAAWVGTHLGIRFDSVWLTWGLGILFIALGLWMLQPDHASNSHTRWVGYGPLLVSFVAFFLAEMGDKTQVATIALAMDHHRIWLVTLGTTLGMLLANLPVVLLGSPSLSRLPLHKIRYVAACLFVGVGIVEIMYSL